MIMIREQLGRRRYGLGEHIHGNYGVAAKSFGLDQQALSDVPEGIDAAEFGFPRARTAQRVR
ncbi:hypothetical protein [Mycolicibacterium sphagni]|uniref:hypothetical protein n=1 Tax=Mycolicibacterium sphagni TaxID=1786 RepID=UPI0010562124|nr:hypothetical protein [Mycolicibacterium sphagni]